MMPIFREGDRVRTTARRGQYTGLRGVVTGADGPFVIVEFDRTGKPGETPPRAWPFYPSEIEAEEETK